jgi:hypothetical protein
MLARSHMATSALIGLWLGQCIAAMQPNNNDFTLCWDEPNEFLVGSSRTACNLKRLPTILLRTGRNRNCIDGIAYILALFSFCGFLRILLGQAGTLSVQEL